MIATERAADLPAVVLLDEPDVEVRNRGSRLVEVATLPVNLA